LETAMRIITAAAAAAVLLITPVLADPVGVYDVAGTNPGGGSSYQGQVAIERTGETYRVTWDIAGTRYSGTALGDDKFLAVSYRSGNDTGLALYGAAGQDWQGVWTYAGGRQVGGERWTRR
jgi:hypothetical protein